MIEESFRRNCLTCRTDGQSAEETGWADMIETVTFDTIMQAAEIHSESWKESHKAICSPAFLERHTPEYQRAHLEERVAKGARLYMLSVEKPVGIVSVHGSLIENLYILPGEQNKGYGTQLLAFAVQRCVGTPVCWVLHTNDGARRFYERNGFQWTGNRVDRTETLYELEYRLCRI